MDTNAVASDLLRTHFFRTMSVGEIEPDEFYDQHHNHIENFLENADIKFTEYEIREVSQIIYSELNDYIFFPQ